VSGANPDADGIIVVSGRHHLFSKSTGLLRLLQKELRRLSPANANMVFTHTNRAGPSAAGAGQQASEALRRYFGSLLEVHRRNLKLETR
jgi:hypothetical protein